MVVYDMKSKDRNGRVKIKYGRYTVRWMYAWSDKAYIINRGYGMEELPKWLTIA